MFTPSRHDRLAGRAKAAALLAAMLVLPIASPACRGEDGLSRYRATFDDIMGTESSVIAVAASDDTAQQAIREAREALKGLEQRLSTYIPDSEVSRLNAAPGGREVKLSGPTRKVLDRARRYRKATDGAFDATVRPILNVWKRAAKAGRMPTEAQLAEAARLTGAGVLKITDRGASKSDPRVQVDLGGIAKGVGIDRALEAMVAAGCEGAMVEVGGDVRVHGDRGDGGKWRILVRSPFAPGDARGLGILEVESGAVCTSGNYFRFFRIGETKFSHIVDPRTGRPVDSAPSVTVLASTAEQADAWATALSVLGPEGLKLLKEHPGIEALVISGGPDDYKAHATPGFAAVLAEGPLKRRLADGP